ncbi:MAG: hypothetical protein H6915_00190 [Novosphingobium sp.]|nr:hypothetical protein [Novosphingobium sp.]
MATMPIYDAVPDVRGYNSDRVFNGVRKLDDAATARHRANVLRLLAKRKKA